MSCVKTLKQNGYKLTPQRKLIIDAIHSSDEHLTIEKIIELVQTKMPEVHKSTIYRTMELLEYEGCVFRSEWGDHFIYHHTEEGHHHHLFCNKCGKTVECNEDLFSSVEKSLVKDYSFKVHFTHVVINGICEDCASKTD